MNKYYATDNYYSYDGIEGQLMPDENVLWKGTPKKNAFVINSSMTMMPIALLWLAVDGGFIAAIFQSGGLGEMMWFVIPFFLLHLLPVWIWLYNVFTAGARWKNTEYAVTDKRIIMRNGLIGYEYKSIYYTEVSNVSLHVGVIDRMLGVGDIYIYVEGMRTEKNSKPTGIIDVEEAQRVFAIVQKTVVDIQADIHYPNALRPDVNPGYKTQYRP